MMRSCNIIKKKKLRSGFTTGTCAAAAAKAGVMMLLSGQPQSSATILTPNGIELNLPLLEIEIFPGQVSCAVKKDSGDDPDITNGILIYATVCIQEERIISILGGRGIGRVTKPGLACAVGEAAINPVPREMIISEVSKVCEAFNYSGGLSITISAPEGEVIAQKTFNPRLGIVGGISILGTSGIVEPMSEKAWIDTIYLEMKQQNALGNRNILMCPGNYGEAFMRNSLRINIATAVKCSNFIGEALDFALELELQSILLIGHAGKLVKLAAGIMNTHSRAADARMEVIGIHAALEGIPLKELSRIMTCNTTEEAAIILKENGKCEEVFSRIMNKINFYVQNRVQGRIKTGVVMFSNELGVLGKTSNADELIEFHQAKTAFD